MRFTSNGSAKAIVLAAAAILGLALLAAILSKAAFESFAKARADRAQEKSSARGVLDAAENVIQGKEMEGSQQFPDTPIGRMNRLMFGLVRGEQERQKQLEAGLKEIGWDWVMTPDSLRTQENLDECLRRVERAKKLIAAYTQGLEESYAKMLSDMEAEASHSDDAREFFEGFRSSIGKRGGGLYYAREMAKSLAENHRWLEASLRFLRQRTGQYTVKDDGTIEFKVSVPQREREAYDDLIDKTNAALERVQALDEERIRIAQENLRRAREALK